MNVGVYVDGFNLYFGARALCGGSVPGWRWIDIRALASTQLPSAWSGAVVDRVVYCTARVSGLEDPTSPHDQDRYLRALSASGSVDHIEYGNFTSQVRVSPLVTWGPKGKPVVAQADWPLKVKDASRVDVPDAIFMVSHLHREEKRLSRSPWNFAVAVR